MVVCVLRKVSLVKRDHCYHVSCIKFEGFISCRGALWCRFGVFVNRGWIGMVGVGWLTSSSRNLSEALDCFS